LAKESKSNIQRYTPYILAIALAVIGISIKLSQSPIIKIEYLLFQLICFILIFLSIWFINSKIKNLKWYLILFINIVLVGFYIIVTHKFFNDTKLTFLFSIMRILMSTILILVLQRIINSQIKNKKLIVENLQLKAENYKAELENLKKQLNPHFLFNSLTTLQTVIRKDVIIAEEYVIKLSELYRNILLNSSVAQVKFKDELAFAESYIFLQKTRFKNGLKFEIHIKKESLLYSLPTFSLQLLIENCIKHNIVSDEKPLHISITQNNLTSITVSNNLQPKVFKDKPIGTGLSNLSRRYELIGINDGLIIEESDKEYSVTLKFF
jgi:two-component system, LytTR family, sensor kinase